MKNLILLTLSTLIGTIVFAATANACIEKPANRGINAIDIITQADYESCSNQQLTIAIQVMDEKVATLAAKLRADSPTDQLWFANMGALGAFRAARIEMKAILAKRGK